MGSRSSSPRLSRENFATQAANQLATVIRRLKNLSTNLNRAESDIETDQYSVWTSSVTPTRNFRRWTQFEVWVPDVQDKLEECIIFTGQLRLRLRRRLQNQANQPIANTMFAILNTIEQTLQVSNSKLATLAHRLRNVNEQHIPNITGYKWLETVDLTERKANEMLYLLLLVEHQMNFTFAPVANEQQIETEARQQHIQRILEQPRRRTAVTKKELRGMLSAIHAQIVRALDALKILRSKLDEARDILRKAKAEKRKSQKDRDFIEEISELINDADMCLAGFPQLGNEIREILNNLRNPSREQLRVYVARLPEIRQRSQLLLAQAQATEAKIKSKDFGQFDL